jgi:quercetin dioxygenase-like cupin family protein
MRTASTPTAPLLRTTAPSTAPIRDGPRIQTARPSEQQAPPQLKACKAAVMDIITLSDASAYDHDRVVAEPFLEGSQSNVRLIRLSPGQALPRHTHGSSDLMLFAVEGEGVLDTEAGRVGFGAGSLAFYRGDEELRVSNEGLSGLTLLAFLAPPFPPRSET